MGQIEIRQAGAGTPAATGDFFICDMPWASPKDDMATMEHPLFTLATRPDRRILRYNHGEASIEVTPSVKGLATIHDKDVLIYCVSQLMAALNEGRPTGPVLQLTAHDLLVATNRETSGDGYRRLREALERLSGTRIVTNIATGGMESTRGFGLIDSWEILRKTRGGRMIHVTVTLSDWMYRSVVSKSVLTLHRDYFHLRKPWSGGSTRSRASIAAGRRSGDRAGDAPEENWLDQPAAGVPQDAARHDRRGRATGLCVGADRRRRGAGAFPRQDGRRGC